VSRPIFFLLASIALLSVRAQAQAVSPPPDASTNAVGTAAQLTLQQAEAIAIKNNPQITIGRLRALAAQQYVREARSALLPNAYLSLTAVDANPGSRLAAGSLTNSILYSRAADGVSVSQLVTDFGRTTNLLSSSEYNAKAEDQTAAATRADILLVVDQAFYNSLETKALVTVAEETVHSRQTLVDKVQALTNAKLKSDIDLSFSNVDLARGKLLLLEAQNNYQTSLAALSAILGYSDEQNFQLVEETAQIIQPVADVAPLIQQALQQRPEIKSLQFQVESAQKFGSAEHDLVRPTINALGVVGQAPVRDNHIESWYGAVGVNINIPVFNGFLYNARGKAADLQTEAERQKLLDTRNNIARDVRNAWHDSLRAFERLSVTQQLRDQANLSLDLAKARYDLGLGSIVEFTQAELQKTEADIQDTDAKYQYHLTQIVLAFTIAAPK
jgi:outer membrane protein